MEIEKKLNKIYIDKYEINELNKNIHTFYIKSTEKVESILINNEMYIYVDDYINRNFELNNDDEYDKDMLENKYIYKINLKRNFFIEYLAVYLIDQIYENKKNHEIFLNYEEEIDNEIEDDNNEEFKLMLLLFVFDTYDDPEYIETKVYYKKKLLQENIDYFIEKYNESSYQIKPYEELNIKDMHLENIYYNQDYDDSQIELKRDPIYDIIVKIL